MFWNVAGIKRKDSDFWKFIEQYDFVGLTETWIEEKDWTKMKKFLPEGFVWKCLFARRIKRKGRAMGGIITGVRAELAVLNKVTLDLEEIVERRIKMNKDVWRVVTVYNRES